MKLRATSLFFTTLLISISAASAQTNFAGKIDTLRHLLELKGPFTLPPLPRSAALPVQFGDAIQGLTPTQLAAFAAGFEEFQTIETPAGGLGPIFNNRSCASCHFSGGVGGASPLFVTRFGRMTNGVFDPLTSLGGSLLQSQSTALEARELIPLQANVIAFRQTTPLFGLGLIEAIPDRTILLKSQQAKPDGVKGRASVVQDVTTGQSRIGRFGWKAQQATLLAFSGDAYLNEMGVTSRFFPTENAPNGKVAMVTKYDPIPGIEDEVDPATGRSDIDASADFMRYLAPPPAGALSASAKAGQAVFATVGCATCHEPSYTTGPSAVAALSQKNVPLYSDLLLHDMGSLNDGIGQGAAQPSEMKTAPLWGLRVSAPYLHDGRALTVDAAIRGHAGEATTARTRYIALPAATRQQLLDFLNSI